MLSRPNPQTIDEYITAFPPKVQSILKRVRAAVKKAAPSATEKISYRMPALALNGIVIYFAAFKNHIGLFPPLKGDEKLQQQLAPYKGPKGNLRFPLDKPIPYPLIGRVVKARVKELMERKSSRRSGTGPVRKRGVENRGAK